MAQPASWVGDTVEEFKKLPTWGKIGVGATVVGVAGFAFWQYKQAQNTNSTTSPVKSMASTSDAGIPTGSSSGSTGSTTPDTSSMLATILNAINALQIGQTTGTTGGTSGGTGTTGGTTGTVNDPLAPVPVHTNTLTGGTTTGTEVPIEQQSFYQTLTPTQQQAYSSISDLYHQAAATDVANAGKPVTTVQPSPVKNTSNNPIVPYNTFSNHKFPTVGTYSYNGTNYKVVSGSNGRVWGVDSNGKQVLLYAPASYYGAGGMSMASFLNNFLHLQNEIPHYPSTVSMVK